MCLAKTEMWMRLVCLTIMLGGMMLSASACLGTAGEGSSSVQEKGSNRNALWTGDNRKFFGMFLTGAGSDSENIEPLVIGTTDRLTVVQDFKSPSDISDAAKCTNIVAAHDKGNVVHLNLNPDRPAWDSDLAEKVAKFGDWLAGELGRVSTTIPGIFITIGSEMNGTWTPNYGCNMAGTESRAAEFVAMHNNIVTTLRSRLVANGIPVSKMRIIWGPNVAPSGATETCRAQLYWPGWSWVDLVGYSHFSFAADAQYQSGAAIVRTAIRMIEMTGLDPNSPIAAGKAIILQTGMERSIASYSRRTWVQELFQAVRSEPRIAGVLLFNPPNNGAEQSLRWVDYSSPPQPLDGFDTLREWIANTRTFEASVAFMFQRPQVRASFLWGSNIVVKGGMFGTVGLQAPVRIEYGSTDGQRRVFSGVAEIVKDDLEDVVYVPLASLPSFSASQPFFAGIGAMEALPDVRYVFPFSGNMVIKGRDFGTPGSLVPVTLEYETDMGEVRHYSQVSTVLVEGLDHVVYIPLNGLDIDVARPFWALVGWAPASP